MGSPCPLLDKSLSRPRSATPREYVRGRLLPLQGWESPAGAGGTYRSPGLGAHLWQGGRFAPVTFPKALPTRNNSTVR